MIKLNTPDDDDPDLDQSRLLHALRQTILYADEHGGIGLTQTKAFNRKFAHWAADSFDWPEYSTDQLLSIQKVLNEWDVPPVGVTHDVLTIAKWGTAHQGDVQVIVVPGQRENRLEAILTEQLWNWRAEQHRKGCSLLSDQLGHHR